MAQMTNELRTAIALERIAKALENLDKKALVPSHPSLKFIK